MPFRDDDEDDTTDTCPYCGASVYDDAVRCPRCQNYLSREDAPSRHPWWIVLTAIVCVLLVLGWILGRGW